MFQSEYQRAVDDRTRLIAGHREFVNHLKQTLEIKDNKFDFTYNNIQFVRIRHLEHTVEQLQYKLITNFKQNQLRVVKQGSVPANEQEDNKSQQPNQQSLYQQHQEGDHPQVQQGVPRVIIGGSGASGSHGQPQQQNWSLPAGHQQRFRIIGVDGADNHPPPQLHNQMGPNPSYFDDEMDDEEVRNV